ncbi:MAG TPA: tetratricopeptide repeat protein, partial [Chitinophagaceae bacterium]|nr:tetratricopeptide repeat protein [Chitinophagaceae bacterium]
HQLANQFRIVNNYILALHYYIESLKIKERLNDQAGYSRSLSGIGSVYRIQGDYQSALSYFNKALEIQKKFKYNYRQAYTSSQIGETYEAMNQPDSAFLYFQTSYAYFNSDQNKFQMVKALNGLGRVQTKLGNTELALSYFRMGTINAIAYTDSVGLAENYLGIGKLFQKTAKIDSSILYAKKAISATQNIKGEVVIEANQLLFNLYLNKNDKEAIKYLSKAMDARDSTFSADKILQIRSISFAEEERQKEINEKKLKDAEERKNNLQYAAIIVALITFIIVFFLLSRSIIVKTKFIEFFGVLGLLAVFEFINLFIHPYLAHATNDSPVLMLAVLIAIGALLIPLHHKLEKWITKIMVEKIKKIRLEAAKKTIQQLEG